MFVRVCICLYVYRINVSLTEIPHKYALRTYFFLRFDLPQLPRAVVGVRQGMRANKTAGNGAYEQARVAENLEKKPVLRRGFTCLDVCLSSYQ